MSTVWMTLLKFALSVVITAIGQIPASSWAKLSTVLTDWLQKLSDNLPAGSPAFRIFSSYRAPASKMIAPPKSDADLWGS